MIKSDEIEILEDSVKNGEISNRKGNTNGNRQYFYVLFTIICLYIYVYNFVVNLNLV